jgi:hypothetical protein
MSLSRHLSVRLVLGLTYLNCFAPSGLCVEATTKDRQPVPPPGAVRASTEEVRELFREDYAKASTPEKKVSLSKELRSQANKTSSATERWVLLNEAARLAGEAGDLDTVIEALKETTDLFAVDRLELEAEAFTKLAAKASLQGSERLAQATFRLAREATGEKQAALAQRCLNLASALAKKSRNASMAAEIARFQQAQREEEKAARELATLEAKLSDRPHDPDVCLEVGRYLCFNANDWKRGLPLLANGSDELLAKLANAEAAASQKPAAVAALGDSWWEWAGEQKGAAKTAGLRRAAEFYATILEQAQGLNRVRLEKRIHEALADSAARSKRIALADLDVASSGDIFGGFRNDGTIAGVAYACGGKPWPKGLCGHVTDKPGQPSSMVYRVPKGARRLVGSVGVVTPSPVVGTADQPYADQLFEIFLDGKSVWKSPPLAKRDETAEFDVLVHNAQMVELQVRSVSAARAWAAWLNPEFAY